MRQIAKPAARSRGRVASTAKAPAGIRCAIYTRKSSEEGLEQAFNSLHAQREACEAYVLSQRHEGWTVLPALYDDGGISGGTMERPALRRLLADIASGRIDAVVVYKVDRLTRSLGDFARIVEVFDAASVSFVSVTQQFNTTTSMGRLTLNMLLSFAQFEREVTGERIRDKVAASKKKGIWMGGPLPLGYDVRERKLVVNDGEAETVRRIFRRYLALGSVQALQEELNAAGTVSKRRVNRFGRESGGKPFGRGALYRMLQNRIYRGEIVHREESYPGQHAAIVDAALWEAVQALLERNRVEQLTGARAIEPSLLAGLVFDETGERMTPTHANKKGVRYRYYVSQPLLTGARSNSAALGRRVPAGDLEGLVGERIVAFLRDGAAIFEAVRAGAVDATDTTVAIGAADASDGADADAATVGGLDAAAQAQLTERSAELAGRWPDLSPSHRRALLRRLVARIEVGREGIELAIRPQAIAIVTDPAFDPTRDANAACPGDRERGETNGDADCEEPGGPLDLDMDDGGTGGASTIILTIPARLKRTGRETRLLIEGPGGAPRRDPDRSLLRLLARAQHFRAMVVEGNGASITELAEAAGVTPSYFTRVLRLGFLSPAAVRMILDGGQPIGLSAKHLSLQVKLPGCWQAQARLLASA